MPDLYEAQSLHVALICPDKSIVISKWLKIEAAIA